MNKIADKVLVKEYKGKTYKVIVKSGKFFLGNTKKKAHRSLSGIAQTITGHPTSGLGFFDLLKK